MPRSLNLLPHVASPVILLSFIFSPLILALAPPWQLPIWMLSGLRNPMTMPPSIKYCYGWTHRMTRIRSVHILRNSSIFIRFSRSQIYFFSHWSTSVAMTLNPKFFRQSSEESVWGLELPYCRLYAREFVESGKGRSAIYRNARKKPVRWGHSCAPNPQLGFGVLYLKRFCQLKVA